MEDKSVYRLTVVQIENLPSSEVMELIPSIEQGLDEVATGADDLALAAKNYGLKNFPHDFLRVLKEGSQAMTSEFYLFTKYDLMAAFRNYGFQYLPSDFVRMLAKLLRESSPYM